DAPYSPIERPPPGIPDAPGAMHPAVDEPAPDSLRERTLFDRLAGRRIEPILGRLRPGAPPAAHPEPAPPGHEPPHEHADIASEADAMEGDEEADDNPFTPDALDAEQVPEPAAAGGVKIIPRKSGAAQGKRAARAGQRE